MDYNFCTTGTLDRNRIGHEWKAIGHFTQVLDYHSWVSVFYFSYKNLGSVGQENL